MRKIFLLVVAAAVSLGFTGCYVESVGYESGYRRAYVDEGPRYYEDDYDPGYVYYPNYSEVIYIGGHASRFDNRGRLYYLDGGRRSYISSHEYARNRRAIEAYRAKAGHRSSSRSSRNRSHSDQTHWSRSTPERGGGSSYNPERRRENDFTQRVVQDRRERERATSRDRAESSRREPAKREPARRESVRRENPSKRDFASKPRPAGFHNREAAPSSKPQRGGRSDNDKKKKKD